MRNPMSASKRNDTTTSLKATWDVIDQAASRSPRSETERAADIGIALARRAQQLDWLIKRQAFIQLGADDIDEEKCYRVLSMWPDQEKWCEWSGWYETPEEAIDAAMRGDSGR